MQTPYSASLPTVWWGGLCYSHLSPSTIAPADRQTKPFHPLSQLQPASGAEYIHLHVHTKVELPGPEEPHPNCMMRKPKGPKQAAPALPLRLRPRPPVYLYNSRSSFYTHLRSHQQNSVLFGGPAQNKYLPSNSRWVHAQLKRKHRRRKRAFAYLASELE